MSTFEKTLLENLIRFSPKNLSIDTIKPLLWEQADYVERWKTDTAVKAAFTQWENEISRTGAVKLVKTNEFKPVINDPVEIPATFWNNFVTIDGGMANPNELKQEIDRAIANLQTQGANLQDPNLIITIDSMATESGASVTPNTEDNTGKSRIDHDYNGLLKFAANGVVTPESKAAFDANQQKDLQFGNKILAQKRGDSAAAYIRSKGIKAKIQVNPIIKAQTRGFVIKAQVIGKEKFVAPLVLPDIKLTLKVGATWKVMPATQLGGQSSAYIFPEFTYYGTLTTSTGVNIKFNVEDPNKGGQNANDTGLRWLTGGELLKMSTYNQTERNPLFARSGQGDGANGDRLRTFFAGCGHFDARSANLVVELITQGAGKLIASLTQFNAINWLKTTSKSVGVTKDASYDLEQNRGVNFWGKLISKEEVSRYTGLTAGTAKYVEQTFNLQQLAAAAVASGITPASEAPSIDVRYWTTAGWFDATTNPSTYGINLTKNPGFFQDIRQFNMTPITK
jgi:hypothetical protein